MAEVEEPRFTTLAERIAALNQQKNFQTSPPVTGKRAPPPPPTNRPASSQVTTNGYASKPAAPHSPSLPSRPKRTAPAEVESAPPLPRRTTAPQNEVASPPLPGRPSAPALPTRPSASQQSPALPPRRPSAQTLSVRRNSNASDISYLSTVSSVSLNQTVSSTTSAGSDQQGRRLPPTPETAKLPPLLPARRELEAKAKEEAAAQAKQATRTPLQSIRSAPVIPRVAEPARPPLPPRLPSRPARSSTADEPDEQAPALPARRMPPPPTPWNRAKSAVETERSRPSDDAPPPLPLTSRPTLAQIDAIAARAAAPTTSARPASAPPATASCLVCRDFSEPDAVAARFPYQQLPRQDPIGYLAHVLCDPFPSATDKARAIFTWCHHNVAYDVDGFFNDRIPRGQTPDQTIFSGKAVCEGYARVYESIARRAGLECVVVGGHGKGYGFRPLPAGQAPPRRDPSGHAWNAVRIDGGEWKLIDACWGAGAVDKPRYIKRFAPEMFTLANDLFGLKHFPADARYFFRSDGSVPTWEEYIVGPLRGEQATWYGQANVEGLNEFTFAPREKQIAVRGGEVVRFQLGKVCEHWDGERNGAGKPLLLMVKIHDELVPLDYDGFWWWIDVPARDLGSPGQQFQLLALKDLNGQGARGMTKEKFLGMKASHSIRSMSWEYVVGWELV